MLAARYGDKFQDYLLQREKTRAAAADYAERADAAELNVIYRFGDDLINDAEVTISRRELRLPGFGQSVLFKTENPWPDMQ